MYIEDDEGLDAAFAEMQTGQSVPQLTQIFDGVADHETTFALLNRYGATSPFAHLGIRAGQWFETTEDHYWHFLECMPPLHMHSNGFIVCECVTGDLYTGFITIDERFFCITTRWQGPKAFDDLGRSLINEVRS